MRCLLLALFLVCFSCILTDTIFPNDATYKYIYTSTDIVKKSSPQTISIYIDNNFLQQDKDAMKLAVSQWNYVLNQQMVLNIVDFNFNLGSTIIAQGQAFFFLRVNSTYPNLPDEEPEPQCKPKNNCHLVLAWVDKIGGSNVRVVRDRVTDDSIEYIMLHEIGHLLHLQHVKSTNALMYQHYTKYGYLCVDRDSMQKVADYYNLDSIHMNYCVNRFKL